MPLNPQQKAAVEYLDGPLLVLAGPGTGKTQLLSEKVAYILKHTDTNPENILCLTFTETGATNMRERLKTLIKNDALKVNIGTYHAFGSEILLKYKNYAPDYHRKLDAAIDEVTQFQIVKKLRDNLPSTDILRGDNVRDIISVISEAKSAGLKSRDLELVASTNLADAEIVKTEVAPFLNEIVPRNFQASLDKAYQPLYEKLTELSEKSAPKFSASPASAMPVFTPLGDRVERTFDLLKDSLKTALKTAETSEKIAPLTAWKNANFEKDPHNHYRLKDRVANLKLRSVAKVMQDYQNYLEENGLYDFDDMILEAVRILTTDEGFRLTLSEQYQYIMLDEFQDTNPSQLAIIKALTAYEKPNIMAVGDDDQAIYEFQGAKSTNLLDFQKHYAANVIPLVENYRSTQEILDFSRQIISRAPDRFADKELIAHQKDPETSQIYRFEFLTSEQEYSFIARKITELVRSGVKQSEIAVISYKTKYFLPLLTFLKAEPEIKIAYEKRDDLFLDPIMHQIFTISRLALNLANGRPVAEDLVEVLAYPFFNLPSLEVVKLLSEARSSRRGFFEVSAETKNPEIQSVMQFLADLAAKSLTEPLEIFLDFVIGAIPLNNFRSPLLAFYTNPENPNITSATINAKNPNNHSAVTSSDNRGSKNASAVANSEKPNKESPAPSDQNNQNSPDYAIFHLYENLAALRGKLKRHFGDKALRPADLITFLSDYEEAEMSLNTTSPYKEADEAVQILTAHKAKGLEFEHVFILDTDHTAWGKGKGNNNLLALPKNLSFIRHTGTTDGEKLRILYVALTRAKKALYLTNAKTDFSGKSPERLEYLEETEQRDENGHPFISSPYLPSGRVISVGIKGVGPVEIASSELGQLAPSEQYSSEPPLTTPDFKPLQLWLTPFFHPTPDMRALYREKVANYRLSATALTSFIDIVYAGPEEFFKRQILSLPSEPETEQLAVGNLVHTVFEAITKQGISKDEAIALFLSELEKRPLPSEIATKIREKGPADLEIAIDRFEPILRLGQAEVDLSSEKITVHGVPITGKIDHLIVDETTKTLEIYDFKTAKYRAEKWNSHLTLYKYALQLEFYRLLLKNSRSFSKYQIKTAHILFVTPDHDGEVYDKIYDFSPETEQELIKLLVSLYPKIQTLSFLDDPEIFISPDKNRKLADIKAFVEKIVEKAK